MNPSARHDEFERMYRAHSGAILGYCVRRTGDATSAADLLADVFLVAWRRHETLPPVDEQRPWLFGIARNVLFDHHRRNQRDTRLGAKLADALVATRPEAQPDSPDDRVLAALNTLSTRDRELLTLAVWDGLTTDEIAVIIGIKPTAVRVAMHRARQRLREALASSDADTTRLSPAEC